MTTSSVVNLSPIATAPPERYRHVPAQRFLKNAGCPLAHRDGREKIQDRVAVARHIFNREHGVQTSRPVVLFGPFGKNLLEQQIDLFCNERLAEMEH
jgi:hypothetical protein